jgi:hypothetical protein
MPFLSHGGQEFEFRESQFSENFIPFQFFCGDHNLSSSEPGNHLGKFDPRAKLTQAINLSDFHSKMEQKASIQPEIFGDPPRRAGVGGL